jgi:nitroimidazol reductase NimA-like FMN-containing flavoprotein (pyridoxamine 5'-phosphate oxidase superfamily)
MPLSREEREQFLAETHIAALSVASGDDRGPLTVPVWYHYTPGGEPWLHTGAGSRKTRLIEAAGFFTLMVQRAEPTMRYVAVDGAVSRIEPSTEAELHELAERYLPPERRQPFVDRTAPELGSSVTIYLQPQHWLSAAIGQS